MQHPRFLYDVEVVAATARSVKYQYVIDKTVFSILDFHLLIHSDSMFSNHSLSLQDASYCADTFMIEETLVSGKLLE